MQAVLRYWFVTSGLRFWRSCGNTVAFLEATIAVKDTAKNWNKPLYQDYSREGRFVGFFIRLLRILSGIFLYSLIGVAFISAYAAWMAAPLVWILGLVRSLSGGLL